ncbi:MAG: YncE family protein [Acidobacteriaceae bacterium]
MRLLARISATSLALVLLAGLLPAAQTNWQVTKSLPIGGEGGWDYVTVDAPTHRLFVTRSTHTMVIDARSGKVLGDIPGQQRSHGVAIVPRLGRGFITDGGGSGNIVVFDLKTYAVLGKLATMPDSDGIIYDETLNRVLAVSGDGGALMTFKPDIDPKNGKIDAPIMLGGAPEFLASDGTGKVYINLEDKDVVAVVDLKSRKVIARWPVAPGGQPVGMSMDARAHRIFIGCRKPQKLIVMSTQDGKVEASLPIGTGVDTTVVNEGKAFASCRDGSLSIIAEKAGKWAVEQVVKTPDGARTMGMDTATHQIYLPTAEFDTASSAGRPKAKPNSFMIVVVGHR